MKIIFNLVKFSLAYLKLHSEDRGSFFHKLRGLQIFIRPDSVRSPDFGQIGPGF